MQEKNTEKAVIFGGGGWGRGMRGSRKGCQNHEQWGKGIQIALIRVLVVRNMWKG